MLDARKLIRLPPARGRHRAQSIFWHRVDELECECSRPHHNCTAVPCSCPRHKFEIN